MRIGHADESVVKGNRARRGAASLWLLLLLLPMIGLLAGFLGGVVTAYVTPRQFESRAVVQVMPATGADAVVVSGDAVRQVSQKQFFATEFEVIKARKTLERVVGSLDLVSRWGMTPDECVATLKEIVRVEQIRGTDLIEVRVRHTLAEEARDVAGQVVRQYRDRRNEEDRARSEKVLRAMDEDLRKQQDIVEEKRKVLDTIVQAVGVSIVDAEDEHRLGRDMAQVVQAAQRNFEELDRERESLEIQIKQLDALTHEELLAYAAGLQLPLNGVASLYGEYRSESTALNELLDEGMGDAHPKVVAQRVRVDVLRKDLNQAVAVLREILKTQMELVSSRLQRMQQVVDERREGSFDRGVNTQDYLGAKRDYEEALAVYQHRKLAHSERRIEASIPRNPITIHEVPREGRNPVAPNVTLYLGGGALGGAALGVVLAILIGLVGKMVGRKG